MKLMQQQQQQKKALKREKVQEDILKKVNQYIRQGLGDKRLTFVSITKVELNDDLSVATLYWDTFDTNSRGEIKKAIEGVTGKVRHFLAQVLGMRLTPQISFVYDSQYESEKHITDLLEKEGFRSSPVSEIDPTDPTKK